MNHNQNNSRKPEAPRSSRPSEFLRQPDRSPSAARADSRVGAEAGRRGHAPAPSTREPSGSATPKAGSAEPGRRSTAARAGLPSSLRRPAPRGGAVQAPRLAGGSRVRLLAWQSLMRWQRGGIFAETLVAREGASLSRSDRALLQAILYGCLRHLSWLDHLCTQLRPGKLEPEWRALILTGLCQLFILHQAEHAAVSETVSLAPKRVRGLVNAVLREALRRRSALLAEREQLPPALRYSAPEWLVQRWVSQLGADETAALLAWNCTEPPVYARLNPLSPMQPPAAWQQLPGEPLWYRIVGPLPLRALEAGQLYIADPSTRHSIRLLDPRPGEHLLDACAAPGGKSVAMIGATGGDLHLLATDLHEHRLPKLRENLRRAGGRDVRVAQHDWTLPCPDDWRGQFDGVLLDVPCSNTGVLQRRVDARWRLDEGEITRLAALQKTLLQSASAAVRPGGRIVYSTCSIDREEDRAVVDDFLAANPEFEFVDEYLALPHREHADGAYAALLRRRS